MSRARRATALVAALAACLAPAAANAPTQVGIAAALLGRVAVARGGAAQLRPAVLRQQVALADRVETGTRSQLQILLLDRSTFTVGANARLTIDRFVYDPAQGRTMGASVAKGAFRFMSGRPSRGGASTITTPVASIGIRGTIVDGVVGAEAIAITSGERSAGNTRGSDPETATLVVLRGPGANTRGNVLPGSISVSAGGKTVELERPLLAVYVPRIGAQPIGPFAISLGGMTRLQGLIFPALAEWRLATTPAPVGGSPMPLPQRRQRPRPVLVDDPYGGGPDGDPGGGAPGGMIPSYGSGIPSLPSMPRGAATRAPQQEPAARTATTGRDTPPAGESAPPADPPQFQQPTPPPPQSGEQPSPEQTPTPAPAPAPTPMPTQAPEPPPQSAPDYPPNTSDTPPPSDKYPASNYSAPNQAPPTHTTSGKP